MSILNKISDINLPFLSSSAAEEIRKSAITMKSTIANNFMMIEYTFVNE
jgi:hypothetical protein